MWPPAPSDWKSSTPSHPDAPALVGANAALAEAWSVLAQGGRLYVRDSFGLVASDAFASLRLLSAPRLDAAGGHICSKAGSVNTRNYSATPVRTPGPIGKP